MSDKKYPDLNLHGCTTKQHVENINKYIYRKDVEHLNKKGANQMTEKHTMPDDIYAMPYSAHPFSGYQDGTWCKKRDDYHPEQIVTSYTRTDIHDATKADLANTLEVYNNGIKHGVVLVKTIGDLKAELERVKKSHAELLKLLKMPFAHLGDNNFSSEPWWGIVRESKIGVIGQVLLCGPFFSHAQATDELEGRRYRYGPKAITWEFSGYNSGPWKQFYDKAKQTIANAEKVVKNDK